MSVAPKGLKLCSPVGAEAITYHWPLSRGRSYNGAVEIVETIKLVCENCPDLRAVTQKIVSKDIDYNSYESLKTLCDKFNKAALAYKNLNKGTSKLPSNVFASAPLLRHIVQQVYNRSVTEPEKLNSYEPFTPAVYGETSFDLIAKMIEIVRPSEDDVFIDLGSGVGQVIVQMAGGSRCKKCIGIEKAEVPAIYARTVDFEFRKWMKWYGKSYTDFELIEGDFLDPKYREMIMGCSLIFVNNFAFGPEVDHKLKSIFAEMHDGTRIVSSKAFCPLSFRISDRNLSDIGTIMNVSELWSQTGNVSWTDKPVTYYLHTIDRKKLEDYFASMRNNGGGNGSRPELRRSGSKASCHSWSSRESGSSNVDALIAEQMSFNEDHEAVVGTTTRRQYASWLAKQKKEPQSFSTSGKSSTPVPKVIATPPSVPVALTAGRKSNETSEDSEDEDENEEEDEDGEEAIGRKASGKGRRSTSAGSLRRPGRPRKSQATLKAQQAKKKYQKQRRPGHHSLKRLHKKKTQEWIGVLDLFHQQTVSVSAQSRDGRAPLAAIPDQTVSSDARDQAHRNAVATMCAAPLDGFIARMRKELEEFLSYMSTPQYRAQLMENIEKESVRQHTLRGRAMQLERQISRLQEEGVLLLRARMLEVGIQAETPAELLNKAKEIVMEHQALQNRANTLDSELHKLERQNEYLIALCRERDEQVIRSGLLQSMGYSSALSADEAKSSILGEIGLLFNRRRALLFEMSRFENEIQTLEANLPAAANTELILSQLPPSSITIPSVPSMPGFSSTVIGPAVAPISPPTETSSASITPSTTAPVRKRGSVSTPKRKAIAGRANRGKPKAIAGDGLQQPLASADPSTVPPAEGAQEDIEEKIRDIVRKALSVDNAAKRAEKERKARTAERKRGAKATEGGISGAEKAGKMIGAKSNAKGGIQSAEKRAKDAPVASAAIAGIDQTISETISNFAGAVPQYEDRPRSHASSATESAPSDHEDFRTKDSSDTKSNPDQGRTETPVAEYFRIRSVGSLATQRPSSVPVSQSPFNAASQFSISSLIAAASITSAYPRVTSAFARIESSAMTTAARTASGISDVISTTDSGFSEMRAGGEPTAGSIPYVSQFSGASANVGQPGNPHSFSNPGNPVVHERECYQNPFKGTSNTGNAGNPHDYSNPGNPSTPEESDAMEPKVLQPFRIPRRTSKNTATGDSPDTRSPLAHVGYIKREEMVSSWMPTTSAATALKRKRRDPDVSPSKKRTAVADTTATPFDKIMNTMIVPAAAAAATKKHSRSRSVHSETSSGSSRKRVDSVSGAGCAPTALTKELLEKHAACQEVHSFAEKGLMEVLLEHKMMAGRIESHSQIANKLRFTAVTKPICPGPSTPPGSPRGAPSAAAAGPSNRRGPKTPENTPPTSPTPSVHSNSRFSRRSNYSGVSALEPDSVSGQPPCSLAPQVSNATPLVSDQRESRSPSSVNNALTLETLARLTNIDACQLAKCLNEDALRTLQDIDPALLLATLSTLLTTVVKSVQRPAAAGADKGPSNRRSREETGRTSGRDKSEELVTSTSMVEDKGHAQQHQSQPIEMEIASSSRSGTPVLPPPPDNEMDVQHPSIEQQPMAHFQPHQLFQPLFSIPPPALGLANPMATPPPPLVAPPPPPLPVPDLSMQMQQQQLIGNLFLLMDVIKESSSVTENGMLPSEGGMRDAARFMKDYNHGERRRCPSPEPAYTMPPPPRPVRIDYSYQTPRELAVLGPPTQRIPVEMSVGPQTLFNDASFRHHRPCTPPSAQFRAPDMIHLMRPHFPPIPPNPMMPPPLMAPPMQQGPGVGIPSLLDLKQACPRPSFGDFRPAAPPPARGNRMHRGNGRPFRP